MNDVIRYTAATASDNVTDRLDGDNFYPMDGIEDDFYEDFSGLDADENGVDSEFSEALGSLFKRKSTPRFGSGGQGGQGLFGGKLKGLLSNRQEGLGDRLSAREEKLRGRQDRRSQRQTARETRRNLRQVSLVKNNPPQVQQNIASIVTANSVNAPQLKTSVDNMAEGIANQVEEQQTQVVIQEANKMVQTGETTPPIIEIDVTTGSVTEVKDTWWKKQSLGVKIAIIGGGTIALGFAIWGITKISKR